MGNTGVMHDSSIDYLKFFAALIITWSHLDPMLGQYSFLATGGAIGDVLFFFCSGFTLFLGRDLGFFNWYGRRIKRIYPTVFCWAMMTALIIGDKKDIIQVVLHGGGWFVSCIMIYYVILWFIKKYCQKHLLPVLAVSVAAVPVCFFVLDLGESVTNIYGDTYFKWLHYFTAILIGAMCGYGAKNSRVSAMSSGLAVTALLSCVLLFYMVMLISRRIDIVDIQMISLIPLNLIPFFLYQVCRHFPDPRTGWLAHTVKGIGGMCLEIYLVQSVLITDRYNMFFPLNIVVVLAAIVVLAYFLRCLSRVWTQTFGDSGYDMKAIVKWD